ncbi:hypothetical protein FNF29_06161 [Cafeteria roenbergensis]|uniref:PROP1-like PPR domain-containing protein n=1 Tax=Cafeteria roenbergensis TaxID=33653 RepID=A0A5A8C7P4_CAFRO|nr:hypothetical protein FNF29_06161 [Cafeteria roenbergensis]|eukprot:KAA0149073.1 hypothetical protein FNF29_06161 [Cafeteria roenbergensis]
MLAGLLSTAAGPELRRSEALAREDADALVMRLEDGTEPHTVEAWDRAIRAFGAAGRFGEAVGSFARVRSVGLVPRESTFNALIGACAAQGNIEAAMETVEAMRDQGLEPTGRTYGALMHACVEGGDAARALALLGEAARDGVELNNVHFTTVMTGLIRAGEPERAIETYYHMRVHHCSPDLGSYTAVVTACARMDQVEKAARFVEDAREDGLRPNRFLYNALIHAYARSMRYHDKAHDVLGQMRGDGLVPDLFTYRAALLACSHEGDTTRARGYMQEMAQQGIQPDADTANVLLTVYSRAVDPRLAARVAHRRGNMRPHGDETEADRLRANDGAALLELADEAEADAIVGERPWWQDPKKMPEKGMFEMPGDRVGLARVAQRVLSHFHDKDAQMRGGKVPLEGAEAIAKERDAEQHGDPDEGASSEDHAITQQDLLELPEHREWRSTMLEAGMTRRHLEDLEFEMVNGRPDTDLEDADPLERGVLERRARRVREFALAENIERVMRGLPLTANEMRRRARNRQLKEAGAIGYEDATSSDGEHTRDRLAEALSGLLKIDKRVVDGSAQAPLTASIDQAQRIDEQLRYERALEAIASGRARAVPDAELSPAERAAAAKALATAVGRVGPGAVSEGVQDALGRDASALASGAGTGKPVPVAEDALTALANAQAEIDALSELSDMLAVGDAEAALAKHDEEHGIVGRNVLGGEMVIGADGKSIEMDDEVARFIAKTPDRPEDMGFRAARARFGLGETRVMQQAIDAAAKLPPGVLPGAKITAATVEKAAEAAATKAELDYMMDVGAPGNEAPDPGPMGMETAAKRAGQRAAQRVREAGIDGLKAQLEEAERAMAEADRARAEPAGDEAAAPSLSASDELSLRAMATSPVPPGHPEERILRRFQTAARAALLAQGINWREDVDAAAAQVLARAPQAFLDKLDEVARAQRTDVWTAAGKGALPGPASEAALPAGSGAPAAASEGEGEGRTDPPELRRADAPRRDDPPQAAAAAAAAAATAPAAAPASAPSTPSGAPADEQAARKASLRELLRRETGIDLDKPFGASGGVTAFRFASAVSKTLAIHQGQITPDDSSLLDRFRIGKRSLRDFAEGADSELDPEIDLQALASDVDEETILSAYEAGEGQRIAAALLSVMPSQQDVFGLNGNAKMFGATPRRSAGGPQTASGALADGMGRDYGSDAGAYDDPLASDGVMTPLFARGDETASDLERYADAMERGDDAPVPRPSLAEELRSHTATMSARDQESLAAAFQAAAVQDSVVPLMDEAVSHLLPRGLRRAIARRFDGAARGMSPRRITPDGELLSDGNPELQDLALATGLRAGAEQLREANLDSLFDEDAPAPRIPESVALAFQKQKAREAKQGKAAGGGEAGAEREQTVLERAREQDRLAREAAKDPEARRAAFTALHRADRDILALHLAKLAGDDHGRKPGSPLAPRQISPSAVQAANETLFDKAMREDTGAAPSPLSLSRRRTAPAAPGGKRAVDRVVDMIMADEKEAARLLAMSGGVASGPTRALAPLGEAMAAAAAKAGGGEEVGDGASEPRADDAGDAAATAAAAAAAHADGNDSARDEDAGEGLPVEDDEYDSDEYDSDYHSNAAAIPRPPLRGARIYPGYDPCHVVDDRGVVWEPVAPHMAPTPPGMVRRRRSGLAIRGRTHLPRPRSLNRLDGASIKDMLELDPDQAAEAAEAIPSDREALLRHLAQLRRSIADVEAEAGLDQGTGGGWAPPDSWSAAAALLGGSGLGDADDVDPLIHARAAGGSAGDGSAPSVPDHGVDGLAALGVSASSAQSPARDGSPGGASAPPHDAPTPPALPSDGASGPSAAGATKPARPRGMPAHMTPRDALAGMADDAALSVVDGAREEVVQAAVEALSGPRSRGEAGGKSLADRLRARASAASRAKTTTTLATTLTPNPAPKSMQDLDEEEQLRMLGQEDIEERLLAGDVGSHPGFTDEEAEARWRRKEERVAAETPEWAVVDGAGAFSDALSTDGAGSGSDLAGQEWASSPQGRRFAQGAVPSDMDDLSGPEAEAEAGAGAGAGDEIKDWGSDGLGVQGSSSGDDSVDLDQDLWSAFDGQPQRSAGRDDDRSREVIAKAEQLLLDAERGAVRLDDDEIAALHAVIGRESVAKDEVRRNKADEAFEAYREELVSLGDKALAKAEARGIGQGLGPVERALVAATESLQQRRKRAEEQTEPTLAEVLLAVRALQRGSVDASHLYKDRVTGEWATELFEEVDVASAAGAAVRRRPGVSARDLAAAAASPEAAVAVSSALASAKPAETAAAAQERARERLLLYAATGETDPSRAEAVLRGERLPSAEPRSPVASGGFHGNAVRQAAVAAGPGAPLLTSGQGGPSTSVVLAAHGHGALPAGADAASDVEALTDAEAAHEQARALVRMVGGDEDALTVEGAAFASSDTVARMLRVGEAAGILSRHGRRVKRARDALARMVAPGRPGEARLLALQRLSQRVLGGLEWYPRELPKDPLEARASLVEEAEKVYGRLYSHRQAPGSGAWDGPAARGPGEEDGAAGVPSRITLNTMVNMYCNAGKAAKAYRFIEKEFPRWGVSPDERTLRPLVRMHAHQRRMDLAEEVVGMMLQAGIEPSTESWGPLVHGYAREWRLADSVGAIKEMKARGLECPEHWAHLARMRLRDLGVWHRDVPQHPIAWQYSQRNLKHRFDRSKRARKAREFARTYDEKAKQRVSM